MNIQPLQSDRKPLAYKPPDRSAAWRVKAAPYYFRHEVFCVAGGIAFTKLPGSTGWGGGAREEQYSPFSVRFLAKKSSLFSGELDRIRDPERVYYYWQNSSECQMNKDDQV